jgi:hypothetical protein
MLTSEQAMLQSARAGNVAEATGRTLLFVSLTSAAIFGLGLIAQMARLGPLFVTFSLLLLPGLCVLGVETFMRLLILLVEDATYARAIDHVRRYYVDHAPSIRPYLFIAPGNDDRNALLDLHRGFGALQRVTTSANLVGIVTSMLTGLLAALVAWVFGAGLQLVTLLGIGVCSFGIMLQALVQDRAWQRAEAGWQRRLEQMREETLESSAPVQAKLADAPSDVALGLHPALQHTGPARRQRPVT